MKSRQNYFLFTVITVVAFLSLNVSSCSSSRKEISLNKQDAGLTANTASAHTGPVKIENAERNNYYNYLVTAPDSVVEVTINLVGDLMCHMPQCNNSKCATGYDFNPSFEFVKDYLADADVTIGNLELTCAGTRLPLSGYPNFNAPDEYIPALKQTGFDFLVTSNNHSMDTGEEGLLRTIDQIKANGIGYTGTFNSQKDHDSVRTLDIKGLKVAILNYTYGTNGAYPAAERKYMLNVIDSAEITNEVKKALELKPDFVLVFYHYGVEYAAEPIPSQRKAVKWARDAGANLVIGGHPHVVGPCQWFIPDQQHPDTSFVAYSLGNFFSNQNKRYTDAGVVLTLHLQKNFTSGKPRISSAEFLPTWVYRGEKMERKKHVIFPAALYSQKEKLPAYLDSALVKKMKEAFEDTRLIINKYGQAAALKPLRQ
jgi:poly-gamma-glutamate capsule biosynthesis protein CapA/YwtB (metallophosphatase superfamily)